MTFDGLLVVTTQSIIKKYGVCVHLLLKSLLCPLVSTHIVQGLIVTPVVGQEKHFDVVVHQTSNKIARL